MPLSLDEIIAYEERLRSEIMEENASSPRPLTKCPVGNEHKPPPTPCIAWLIRMRFKW